tara:strand:- start:1012 stop:2781 length:1770 start_codon:yes stop_codon:yes gene_type:complete
MTANEIQRGLKVAVLWHRDDIYGEQTANNAIAAFSQARVACVTWDISEQSPDLRGLTALFLCTERLDQTVTGLAALLERFVEEGGGLVVLHRGLSERFCHLFGIVSQDRSAAPQSDYDMAGLVFPSSVLPSFQGLALGAAELDGHAAFDVVPSATASIVATSWTGKPLAWRSRYGKGYVLYWNTTICSESRMRGLIIESLESVTPISLVPLANAGVVQVDDFPAPLAAPAADLVGSSNPDEFYSHRWWPDIHRLASGYDIALSCFAIFDYSTMVDDGHKNPFSNIISANCAAIQKLPPAEMGLHGYNHVPLAHDLWRDRTEMATFIERAIAEWERVGLGPLPTSYVPPMNIYDSDGIDALSEKIPGLRSISGAQKGVLGGSLQREFGPEPWNESLFCLPRATCGHECSPELLFDCASELAAMGVWTHYLHPDDLADTPRSGSGPELPRNPHSRTWVGRGRQSGLYQQLATMFAQVKARFPWLVFRSTSDAAEIVRQFLSSEWQADIRKDTVVVDAPIGGFFRFRTNGAPRLRVSGCEGARIVHHEVADDYCLYVMEMQEPRASILLHAEPPRKGFVECLSALLKPARRQ